MCAVWDDWFNLYCFFSFCPKSYCSFSFILCLLLFSRKDQDVLSELIATQKTQNFCITFVQCRPNVFDVGPTLFKCYVIYVAAAAVPPSKGKQDNAVAAASAEHDQPLRHLWWLLLMFYMISIYIIHQVATKTVLTLAHRFPNCVRRWHSFDPKLGPCFVIGSVDVSTDAQDFYCLNTYWVCCKSPFFGHVAKMFRSFPEYLSGKIGEQDEFHQSSRYVFMFPPISTSKRRCKIVGRYICNVISFHPACIQILCHVLHFTRV